MDTWAIIRDDNQIVDEPFCTFWDSRSLSAMETLVGPGSDLSLQFTWMRVLARKLMLSIVKSPSHQ